MPHRFRHVLLFAAAVTTGCAALRPPAPASIALRASAPITASPTAASNPGEWPASAWWLGYSDATLTGLITRALQQSPDIRAAEARINTAQQNAQVTGAALGIQVNASAAFDRRRLSDNGLLPTSLLGFNWYDQSDLGIAVRYQFDWWGKQRAQLAASLSHAQAAVAEQQATQIALAAAVAESYFGWQADSARIAIASDHAELLAQALRLAEKRAAAQLDPADTVLTIKHSLAVQQEHLAGLQGQRQLRVVTLAALLGISGTELPEFTATTLPQPATSLPDNAGTNLLARRPDIAASRARVEAAMHDTAVARAAFYPDISLQALAGLSSVDLTRLLRTDSAAPTLGVAVDLPLFDAGLRQARHGAATARLAEAIANYDEAVVNAARETGLALARIQQTHAQHSARLQQQAVREEIYRAAAARVRAGLTHLGPQLEAQLARLTESDALVQIELNALLADIQLKQALGGGFAPTGTRP
jgi:outer membrane protein, multidrug efflux system